MIIDKVSQYNFYKVKMQRNIVLLISALLAFMFIAGCSSQSSRDNDDNVVRVSKDKHIVLRSGRVIQQEYHGDDIWERMRNGFQLQNEYANSNSRIRQQQTFLTKNPKSTEQLLAKGSPYLHYILEQLEARNMPFELALLPAVESGYNPTAYSNMKAAGLWQFMPRTGTHFNLQQSRWYDGRLDIMASTNAALDYLEYLHNMFGDWPLALAAYNSGEGTVRRAIQKNQSNNLPTDYWNLSLPTETINYVPKLLALSKIVNAPTAYRINIAHIPNQPYFEKVDINQQVKLETVASLLTLDADELKSLNAGLKAQAIINNESPKQLLIPSHKVSQLNSLLASGGLPRENISVWSDYNIRAGDTLSNIAVRHNTTVNELRSLNNLASNHIIKKGQRIKVPMVATNSSQAQPLKTVVLKSKNKYTIQEGDNLWAISKKNNIQLEKLLKINKLTMSSSIKPGQQLYISERN